MANFCILRTRKLKTNANVGASFQHAFRERATPNADPDRLTDNIITGGLKTTAEAMAKYKKMLPEKIRKNGVRCIEYLITASPEIMQKMSRKQQDEYFQASIEWLKKKHETKNIVFCGVHRDEKTPHLFAYVVPFDSRGKLNCREFLGGREKLSAMQDSFAEVVGSKFNMERGIKGSRARHQTIKEFYARAETLDQALTPPKKHLTETWERYAERYKNQVLPYLKKNINADKKEKDLIKEKTYLKNQIQVLNKTLKAWNENLSPNDLRHLADLMDSQNSKTWLAYTKIKADQEKKERQQKTKKKRDPDWER